MLSSICCSTAHHLSNCFFIFLFWQHTVTSFACKQWKKKHFSRFGFYLTQQSHASCVHKKWDSSIFSCMKVHLTKQQIASSRWGTNSWHPQQCCVPVHWNRTLDLVSEFFSCNHECRHNQMISPQAPKWEHEQEGANMSCCSWQS